MTVLTVVSLLLAGAVTGALSANGPAGARGRTAAAGVSPQPPATAGAVPTAREWRAGRLRPAPALRTGGRPGHDLAQVGHGYWLVAADGGVFSFGDAAFLGSAATRRLQRPVVDVAPTANRAGYWMVGTDGGLFAFGDAHYHGSIPGLGIHPAGSAATPRLGAPIVSMVASPSGSGYLLVASDGGVFAFGNARFHGSCPQRAGGCYGSVVAVVPDAGELGYWLVTSTGRVYAFGNAAPDLGEPATARVPLTGAAPTPSGHGYYLVDARGDVFAYGDAQYHGGSPAGVGSPRTRIVGIVATATGAGYWLVGANGAVFSYGDAPYRGTMFGQPLNALMVTGAGF